MVISGMEPIKQQVHELSIYSYFEVEMQYSVGMAKDAAMAIMIEY